MTLSERLTMFDSDKIDPFTLCGDRVTEDDLLAAEECWTTQSFDSGLRKSSQSLTKEVRYELAQ